MKLSEPQWRVLRKISAGDSLAVGIVGSRIFAVWWRFEPEEPRPRITTVRALQRKRAIEPERMEEDPGAYSMSLTPAGRAGIREAEDE